MDTTRVYEFPIREHRRQPRAFSAPGAVEAAGPEAAAMGLKHVLFVTSGLSGTGIVDEVGESFSDAGVAVTVYDKVESNPKDYNVMDAYQLFAEEQCDGFVSLGGGSSHDTAKGARIVAAHDGRNVNEFAGHQHVRAARQPAADRDQHHRRDRLGDDAGLRHHRHDVGQRAVQVGRVRPGVPRRRWRSTTRC